MEAPQVPREEAFEIQEVRSQLRTRKRNEATAARLENQAAAEKM